MIIKIVTISLMAVFYICYFAKLISQKKQGIKTDQLGKGKEGFVKFIEVALNNHIFASCNTDYQYCVLFGNSTYCVAIYRSCNNNVRCTCFYCFCYTNEGELESHFYKFDKSLFSFS